MKKYLVKLEAYINITNAERIINWQEQGWEGAENCNIHSNMLIMHKWTEVETDAIEMYINALNNLNSDIRATEYELISGITID